MGDRVPMAVPLVYNLLDEGTGSNVLVQGRIGDGGFNGPDGTPGTPNPHQGNVDLIRQTEPGNGGQGGHGGSATYIVDAGSGIVAPVNLNNDTIIAGMAGKFNGGGSFSDIYANNGTDTIIMQNVFNSLISAEQTHYDLGGAGTDTLEINQLLDLGGTTPGAYYHISVLGNKTLGDLILQPTLSQGFNLTNNPGGNLVLKDISEIDLNHILNQSAANPGLTLNSSNADQISHNQQLIIKGDSTDYVTLALNPGDSTSPHFQGATLEAQGWHQITPGQFQYATLIIGVGTVDVIYDPVHVDISASIPQNHILGSFI